MKLCTFKGCKNTRRSYGLCFAHRWQRDNHKVLKPLRRYIQLAKHPDHFWKRVRKTKTCWLWTGDINTRGYGVVSIGGRGMNASRAAWILNVGKIPEGLCVCHTCDNPRCVRISHLFLGSRKDNTRDSIRKDRHARGERSGLSKLKDEDVRLIRSLYSKGMKVCKISALGFPVCYSQCRNICVGLKWKHLKP